MNPQTENFNTNRAAETWVVDQATGLSDLETRLNHLDAEGFSVRQIFVLRGLQPKFVILARHLDQESVEAEPAEPHASLQENEEARRA